MSKYLDYIQNDCVGDWPLVLTNSIKCDVDDNNLKEIIKLAKTGDNLKEQKKILHKLDLYIKNFKTDINESKQIMLDNYLGYKIYKNPFLLNDREWPSSPPCMGCSSSIDDDIFKSPNKRIFCAPAILTDASYNNAKARCYGLNTILSGLSTSKDTSKYNLPRDINIAKKQADIYDSNAKKLLGHFKCLDELSSILHKKNIFLADRVQILQSSAEKKKKGADKEYTTNENLESLNLGANAQMEFAVFQYRRDIVRILSLATLIIYWIVLLNMKKK